MIRPRELTALFTVSQTLGAKAGAVMLCVWNQEREAAGLPQDSDHDTELAIKVAVQGVRNLIKAGK